MHKLIHFRDWGCQGAKEIILSALNMINSTNNEVENAIQECGYKIVFLTTNPEKAQNQFAIWKEVADTLKCEFSYFTSLDELDKILDARVVIIDDALLADEEQIAKIDQELQGKILIAQSLEDDYLSPYALAMFSNFVYTAKRTGKDLYKLKMSWMGDAGSAYNNYATSYLNSTICLQHELALAFPQNEAKNIECSPEKRSLDFSMQAGSKVFLTHDPIFIEETADVLYLTKWSYKESGNFATPAHPFTFSAIHEKFTKDTQIISLIPEIPSSEIDIDLYQKVSIFTRIATMNYIKNLK